MTKKNGNTEMAPVRHDSPEVADDAMAQFAGFMPRAAEPIAETLKRTKGKTTLRISIKAGEQFTGVFEGAGGTVKMEDPADPTKIRDVGTWMFSAPNAPNLKLQVVTWTTLDSELGSGNFGEGQTLTIIRGDKKQSRKGRMFSECLVIEHD